MKISNEDYNDLLITINRYIERMKRGGKEPKYEEIDSYIDWGLRMIPVDLDEADRALLFHAIESEQAIKHTQGVCIFDDYDDPHNWYDRAERGDEHFWRLYSRYLTEESSLDEKSISLLGNKTLPDIMNCLCNPKEEHEGKFWKRGLVIGDVQSGKTATYSGLICKAIDAGYKVVILLAGITENLRQQTQERIDYGVVGREIKKDNETKIESTKIVGVGKYKLPKDPRVFSYTTQSTDFVGQKHSIIVSLDGHNSAVLFVVKKNVSVLSKLYKWLKDNNYNRLEECVNAPLLLIDDEADNASVNTNKDETNPTRTNAIIRKICSLFKTASYVGFTATPFANVFIDPDSVDAMKKADLFPEHFIYTLPTPSSYIGAKQIFDAGSKCYRNIRYIADIDEPDYTDPDWMTWTKEHQDELNSGPFYYRHKKEWDGILPESLRESMYCFFMANVIRDLRGQSTAPRSMLVNMSRFVKVQNVIKDEVERIYEEFRSIVDKDFSTNPDKNIKLPLYIELKRLWDKHYSFVSDVSFERVINKANLYNAIKDINVVVVNGLKSSGKLDYRKNPSLRVIAVGGLALSRGLTLEGLLTSYFYRNTATFDVLMQMGRWFGYRKGYEDIFQIWTSEESARWYDEISKASEDLKDDLKEMFAQRLTPKDFGIKVRDNCTELQITASNKMRTSFDMDLQESFYGNIYETPYISLNVAHNTTNLEQVAWLTNQLHTNEFALEKFKTNTSLIARDVPKEIICEFVRNIKSSKINPNFNTEYLYDFITDHDTVGLDLWDIVFQSGESDKCFDIPHLESVRCAARMIHIENNAIVLSSRRKLLSTREGTYGLTQEQIDKVRAACQAKWRSEGKNENRDIPNRAYFEYLPDRKPLLIIMLIEPKKLEDKDEKPKLIDYREELGDNKMVAFAMGFPGVRDAEKAKHYRVNKVYYQLFMQDESEDVEYDEAVQQ